MKFSLKYTFSVADNSDQYIETHRTGLTIELQTEFIHLNIQLDFIMGEGIAMCFVFLLLC